jgi:hypothetical protein
LPPKVNIGIDGVQRSAEVDRQISQVMASVFSSPSGQEVLRYLRSVTIEMVNGPAVSVNELMHMEGQRYLVGLIERRISHGRSER